MQKLKRIVVPKKPGKIPVEVLELKGESTDNLTPLFSFKHVSDNHCLLCEWGNPELSELIGTLKTMESLTWSQVRQHKGLNLTGVDHPAYPPPPSVPGDASITEVRVDEKRRLFGYRGGRVFHLIWFDRNHQVCPAGKVRRK